MMMVLLKQILTKDKKLFVLSQTTSTIQGIVAQWSHPHGISTAHSHTFPPDHRKLLQRFLEYLMEDSC